MVNRSAFGEPMEKVIDVAVRVAGAHESGVTVEDLLLLLPKGTTIEDVETALKLLPSLQNRYQVRDGLVFSNGRSADDFRARLEKSANNLAVARRFSERLNHKSVLAITVSGSTSYKGASQGDDIDLFCVTPAGGLWSFLARALVLTRVSRLSGKPVPPVCVSCVMDAAFAESTFAKDQGALFARDALVAEPVKGAGTYRELLRTGAWMHRYFPKLYDLRGDSNGSRFNSGVPSTTSRLTNLFLFATLGTFIRAKAAYHNLRLAKAGLRRYSFRAKVGPDHLIYESAKYLSLKRTYSDIRAANRRPA
jgi:hypothetical protein